MPRTIFTSRVGGVSSPPYDDFNLALHVGDDVEKVIANRRRLAENFGLVMKNLVFMEQVHGRQVAVINDTSEASKPPVADALFTMNPDIALVVLTADCIPMLLCADEAVAAVHVGRKGLVAGIIQATIATFNSFGITNNKIRAELGPAICGDCYEVDLDLYREVVSNIPATATDESIHRLDIVAGARDILKQFGVDSQSSVDCTHHSPGYFSYRRDGLTGRQCGAIRL